MNSCVDKKILVTGATGTLGRRLVAQLGEENVTIVGRDRARATQAFPRARFVPWDGRSTVDADAMRNVDVIVHLAGEPVAEGRWTEAKKKRIRDSRVEGTRAVVTAIERAAPRPRVLVCASAVGFYGSRGDETLTEASPAGEGFLADVCKAWEAEAERAEALGVRVVTVRTGIVLAKEGGALAKMLPLFRMGVAGSLGDGRQWMPWIHVDDEVALLLHAMRDEAVRGALDATSPNPVRNAEFSRALARAVHRWTFLPAPRFALRAVLGETADVVLASQRVLPKKALESGFEFRHPDLAEALGDLLGSRP